MNLNRNVSCPPEIKDVLGAASLTPRAKDVTSQCHRPQPLSIMGNSMAHPFQAQEPLGTLVLAHHWPLPSCLSCSYLQPYLLSLPHISLGFMNIPIFLLLEVHSHFPDPAYPKKVLPLTVSPNYISSLNSLLWPPSNTAISHHPSLTPHCLPGAFVVYVPCSLAGFLRAEDVGTSLWCPPGIWGGAWQGLARGTKERDTWGCCQLLLLPSFHYLTNLQRP